MDSDTESESDYLCASIQWDAADFALFSTQRALSNDLAQESDLNIQQYVDTLNSIDVRSVALDSSHHDEIGQASSVILHLLDRIVRPPKQDALDHSLIDHLVSLVEPAFLSRLFEYRRAFHAIASLSLPPGMSSSVVVCWVDVVLTKLAEAIVVIAGASTDTERKDDKLGSLAKQRENDAITAASQLPHHWQDVPKLLISDFVSPVVLRLAIRLTFAAYILHPQLTKTEGFLAVVSSLPPMHQIVHTCASRFSEMTPGARDDYPPFSMSCQERTSYAMIVALFLASAAETSNGLSTHPSSPPSPRPYTQTLVMHLIQIVMHPDTSVPELDPLEPCIALDPAQTILLHWGRTIPNCWYIWDDPRCVGAELISHLTSTWLYHLDSREDHLEHDDAQVWFADILQVLPENTYAVEIAIVQLLHRSVTAWPSSSASLNVLRKVCWAMAQFINPSLGFCMPATHHVVRCLYIVFMSCGGQEIEDEIRNTILEALTYIDSEVLQSAMKSLVDDKQGIFSVRFDTTVAKLRRAIHQATGSSSPLAQSDHHSAAFMLKFLALLFSSNTTLPSQRTFYLGFLCAVASFITAQPHHSNLLCDFLIALSTLGPRTSASPSDRNIEPWDDETLWSLAVACGRNDLLPAAALSAYISASTEDVLTCNALSCAEAWSYIRDVLLRTISQGYLCDDPLALLVAPTLCVALSVLTHKGNTNFVSWAVASPWTTSLCAELRTLLDSDDNTLKTASTILKGRLLKPARELLDDITRNTDGVDLVCRGSPLSLKARLIFYPSASSSHLLLVPSSTF